MTECCVRRGWWNKWNGCFFAQHYNNSELCRSDSVAKWDYFPSFQPTWDYACAVGSDLGL